MELKRVVVTGLGAVTPIGNTPEETWKNMLAGKVVLLLLHYLTLPTSRLHLLVR